MDGALRPRGKGQFLGRLGLFLAVTPPSNTAVAAISAGGGTGPKSVCSLFASLLVGYLGLLRGQHTGNRCIQSFRALLKVLDG
jgi:hypothetical protein